jgi:Raf kinase inhibitor-like YbhB/YbcL family protein
MRPSIVVVLTAFLLPANAYPDPVPSLLVTSTAFPGNGPIPSEYTCDGPDISPQLSWSRVPPATQSIAIVVDDPDAPGGTYTHWVVTGIPPTTTSLPKAARLPAGAMAAKNDKGLAAYSGPCPPSGRHHYRFRVYALDMKLPKATGRAELLDAMQGHVVASGQLVGTYEKQSAR